MMRHDERLFTYPVAELPWRVGRKVPRNLYAMVSPVASDDDIDIGRMDTELLARHVVAAHNMTVRQ